MQFAEYISFVPELSRFQLVLPGIVTDQLGFRDENKTQLSIVHENKMQLEWLAQKIMEQYFSLKTGNEKFKARLRIKKAIAFFILLATVIGFLLRNQIALNFHFSVIYLNAGTFAAGIICLLQLLKYFALGFAKSDLSEEPEIIELRQLIREQYLI